MLLLFFYNQQGVSYTPVTSTTVLQHPVDCVLAGDQPEYDKQPPKVAKKFMRMIFKE